MRVISDNVIAILNIWMEARGEERKGKVAVGEVMRNRLRTSRWGNTIAEVVLAPYQFSGWNTKDSNRVKAMLLDEYAPSYIDCSEAWETSRMTRLTEGALLYCNLSVSQPVWATPDKLIVKIGSHSFFRE